MLLVEEDLGGTIVQIRHGGCPISLNKDRFDTELPIDELRRCDLVTTLDTLDGVWREPNDDPPDIPREETTMSGNRQDAPRWRKLLHLRFPNVLVEPSWAVVDEDFSTSDRQLPTSEERDTGIASHRRRLCCEREGGCDYHLAIDHVWSDWT